MKLIEASPILGEEGAEKYVEADSLAKFEDSNDWLLKPSSEEKKFNQCLQVISQVVDFPVERKHTAESLHEQLTLRSRQNKFKLKVN